MARRMERMVATLADDRAFDLLEAVCNGGLSLGTLYDHVASNAIEKLRGTLNAKSLADYFDGWLAHQRKVAPAAWPDQERQVRRLITDLTTTEELTSGAVRAAMAKLTVSSGTARHYLYAMSSFCNHLVAHGVLAVNPCNSKVLVPRPKKSGKRTEWRSERVDRSIVDCAKGDLRIAFVLCAASGADRATPLVMQVKHLHLLPVGADPDRAKGIEHRVDLPGSKTEGRDRKGVRLEPWAAPILREWVRAKLPNAPLVSDVSKDMMTRWWKVFAVSQHESNYWLRDLRHSYGVRALLAGYTIWEVSKWLGHTSIAMTAEVYTQFEYDVARLVRGDFNAPVVTEPTLPLIADTATG